jgi:hypothetical protein
VSIVDGNQFIWGSGNTNTGLRLQYGLGTSFWINTPSGGTMSIGGIGTSAPSSGVINITSTGNVGIGTTTPSYLLDVKNEQILGILSGDTKVISKFSGRIGGTGGTNSNNFRIISTRLEDYSSNDWSRTGLRLEASIDDSGTANSWIEFRKPTFSSINNQIAFGESSGSSGQWMIIDNGNVGIGIPIPTEKLHVAGNALITGTTFTGNLIVTGSTQSIFSGNSSSNLVRITQTGSGNAFVVEDSSNPDSSPFVIDNEGRVGIGQAPSTGFQVAANGTIGIFAPAGSPTGSLYIDHTGVQSWKIGVSASSTSTLSIGNDLGGAFANKPFNITNAGNVGIGTTSPSEKLHVAGNTIVSGTISGGTMVITTQPTSGYTATQILMRNSTTGQVEITDSTSPSIYNYGMTYAMSTFNYLT